MVRFEKLAVAGNGPCAAAGGNGAAPQVCTQSAALAAAHAAKAINPAHESAIRLFIVGPPSCSTLNAYRSPSDLQLPPGSPPPDQRRIANERRHGGMQLDARRAQLQGIESLFHAAIECGGDVAQRFEHGNTRRQIASVSIRLLALLLAERVISGAHRGTCFVSAALAVDEKRALKIGYRATFASELGDVRGVLENALPHSVRLLFRHARAEIAKQADRLVREDHHAQVTTEVASCTTGDAGVVRLK